MRRDTIFRAIFWLALALSLAAALDPQPLVQIHARSLAATGTA